MLFVTKVTPIISYFFLLRPKKERQSLSVSSFSAQSPVTPNCHRFSKPPHNSGHPFPAVWMHYLETSIAQAFQDGVRLLSCHVALTRVHDRFQPPSATSPSPLKSTPILRETGYGPGLCSSPKGNQFFCLCYTTSAIQSYWLQIFYSLKLPKQFNDCNNVAMTVSVLRKRVRLLPRTNPH